MSMGGQDTKWRRNIAENFNGVSRAHERYRQTTDRRQTDGRQHIANVAKNHFEGRKVVGQATVLPTGHCPLGTKKWAAARPAQEAPPLMRHIHRVTVT